MKKLFLMISIVVVAGLTSGSAYSSSCHLGEKSLAGIMAEARYKTNMHHIKMMSYNKRFSVPPVFSTPELHSAELRGKYFTFTYYNNPELGKDDADQIAKYTIDYSDKGFSQPTSSRYNPDDIEPKNSLEGKLVVPYGFALQSVLNKSDIGRGAECVSMKLVMNEDMSSPYYHFGFKTADERMVYYKVNAMNGDVTPGSGEESSRRRR